MSSEIIFHENNVMCVWTAEWMQGVFQSASTPMANWISQLVCYFASKHALAIVHLNWQFSAFLRVSRKSGRASGGWPTSWCRRLQFDECTIQWPCKVVGEHSARVEMQNGTDVCSWIEIILKRGDNSRKVYCRAEHVPDESWLAKLLSFNCLVNRLNS